MAEIEFKRRGTPLWAVLLALVVLALIVWLFVVGRDDGAADRVPEPTPSQPAPATPGAPGTPGAPATPPTGQGAPAPAGGAVAEYAAFVTETPAPAAGQVATYVSDGLRLLSGAVLQQYPTSAVQVNLMRAMADSLRLPDVSAVRQTDMAQAAFFAAAYAMGRTGPGEQVNTSASKVQLQVPLRQQIPAVREVFRSAREVLQRPAGSPATTPPAGAPKS